MNEHAGPACALSGLIVGIFAILLHDNAPPPAALPPPSAPAASAAPPPGVGPARPEARPAVPPPPPRAVAASPKPASKSSMLLPAVVAQVVVSDLPRSPAPEPVPKPAPRPKSPTPPSPRPSFAIVEPGETLGDVAVRVYGARDATEALWKANRDQVERIDSPLARGTLLRVP